MLTKKQLETMSDLEVAAFILQERLDKVANPNIPIAARLRCAINHIREMDVKEKTRPKGWWFVQFYDEEGLPLRPQDIPETELNRIAWNVEKGFGSGEIVEFMSDEE